MKHVQFLPNLDEALNVYFREVRRYDKEIKLSPGIEKYVLTSIRNRILETALSLKFSSYVNRAFGKRAAVTDIDRVLFVNGRIAAIFETKRRNEDFRKYVMANARQFLILRRIAKRLNVPLIYLYKIEEYHEDTYRILEVDLKEHVEIRELGNGHSRDNYAIWPVGRSKLLIADDFPQYLRGLL